MDSMRMTGKNTQTFKAIMDGFGTESTVQISLIGLSLSNGSDTPISAFGL